MTKNEGKSAIAALNELFAASQDRLREIVRAVMQEMLEAEMTDALGAEKGERPAPDSTTAQATTPARSSRGLASLILRPVLNRALRTLPALRAGLGGDAGRDVRAGRLDPLGQGHHRGTVRPCLLGLRRLRRQQAPR